jgi:hypothetical protein
MGSAGFRFSTACTYNIYIARWVRCANPREPTGSRTHGPQPSGAPPAQLPSTLSFFALCHCRPAGPMQARGIDMPRAYIGPVAPLPPLQWQSAKNDKVLGSCAGGAPLGCGPWVREPVGSRGFALRTQRAIYILYVQAVQKRNPAEPMNFMREKVGSRVPMTADYSDLFQ